MSKKMEQNYKKYLYKNFLKLSEATKNEKNYEDNWYDELISYNSIIGSLIGLIDSKGKSDEIKACKDFILDYYESTYPEKQLREIDDALYSKDCYEYINYAMKYLITDKTDLKLLESFAKSYIKGYNLSREVSLRSVLPYYVTKICKYKDEKEKLRNLDEKLYQL